MRPPSASAFCSASNQSLRQRQAVDGLDRGAAEGLDEEAIARHLEAVQVRRGLRDGAQVALVVHLEPDDVDELADDVDGQEVRAEIDARQWLGDAPRPG